MTSISYEVINAAGEVILSTPSYQRALAAKESIKGASLNKIFTPVNVI